MANDTQLLPGATGGDTIRDFDDGTRKWPAGFIAFGPVVDPGPIATPTVVSLANPLPINILTSVALGITGTVNVAAINQESGLAAGAAPSKMTVIGAQYNTTAPSLTNLQTVAAQCNAKGALYVDSSGVRAVYKIAAFVGLTPGGYTDVMTLYGAANKVIRLLGLELQAVTNNAATTQLNVTLLKRSSVNSGGVTSSPVIGIPVDSNSPTASASLSLYTISPTTLGTQVGLGTGVPSYFSVLKWQQISNVSSNASINNLPLLPSIFTYNGTNPGEQPITLRSASEGIAINLQNSPVVVTNAFLLINLTWSEDVN